MKLPESFPAGTRFADVEDVPVSLDPAFVCRAWDVTGGRPFPITSFSRNGAPMSEAMFRDWVERGILPPSMLPGTETNAVEWVRMGRLDANAKMPEIPPGATVKVRLVNRGS